MLFSLLYLKIEKGGRIFPTDLNLLEPSKLFLNLDV